MLTVDEALAAVVAHAAPGAVEQVPLPGALGRALAAEITSGLDSPPFDKALMDGYALRSADTAAGETTLAVIDSVTAGQVPTRDVRPGQATRIMTGAPMPAGADAVVPIERTKPGASAKEVRVGIVLRPGANVLYRGESMKAGERIYAAGHVLRPQDLGVLAELGVASVPVRRRPRVAILATGDELVPPEQMPGPGQIRNSNESLLAGLTSAAGCEAVPLGIARDVKEELRAKIDAGLACDLLILSGGVSAGDLDLVPSVLKEAGVRPVFHKVNVKPGKPVYFGLREDDGRQCLVFGLPGNPVSTLVCFELFTKTAIHRLLGIEPSGPRPLTATLTTAHENRGDRPTYHPARIAAAADARLTVAPVPWAGSGDLRATAEANGVAVFEAGRTYSEGAIIQALLWPGATL